jgi:hypothetical protein
MRLGFDSRVIRMRWVGKGPDAESKRGSVDGVSAVGVSLEKGLKLLAIQFLVAVLIPSL